MSDPTGATAQSIYVPGFQANLNLAPQQTGSRLLAAVDADLAYAPPGQFFNADDVGTHNPSRITTRVPDSPDGFVDITRRIGVFSDFCDGVFIDNEDLVRQLEDPTNKTMMSMNAGLARYRDSSILSAMLGPYLIQSTGFNSNATNITAGPVNQNVIVSNTTFAHEAENISAVQNATTGGYGLTVGKLIQAKTQLDNSEIDQAMPGDQATNYHIAVTANQLQDLLASIPATSTFYGEAAKLQAGTISYFLGFNFHRLPSAQGGNPLPKSGYTRTCPAWIKNAVCYRGRTVIAQRVTQRADKSFRWYAYYESSDAGVRRYDGGVVAVNCDERTTGFS